MDRNLIKKVLLEYSNNKNKKNLIVEKYQKTPNPWAEFVRQTLEKIYSEKGRWQKIEDPDNDCVTNYGVVGGSYEHFPGKDKWSILNRFDTNSKVKKKIAEIFLQTNPDFIENNKDKGDLKEYVLQNDIILRDWISKNGVLNPIAKELFDEGGKYIEELVALNKETIELGNKNEMFAIDVLKKEFGLSDQQIKRFCSGSVQDTKMGQDIAFEKNGKWYSVQVKPYNKLELLVDQLGKIYWEVSSLWQNHTKYSEKNVNFFMFVKEPSFAMFLNEKHSMKYNESKKSWEFQIIKPFKTNISDIEPTEKKLSNRRTSTKVAKEFGILDPETLKRDLEYQKQQNLKAYEKLMKGKNK